MSVGRTLLRIRQDRGLTQGDVGRKAKLAASYISRIENGRIQPTMPTLARLAHALGVPVSAIFQDTERGAAHSIHRCPVSASGKCIGEEIRSKQGRPPRGREVAYGREELRLLKMTDYVARHGSRETRRALKVVLESLIGKRGGSPG